MEVLIVLKDCGLGSGYKLHMAGEILVNSIKTLFFKKFVSKTQDFLNMEFAFKYGFSK